MVKKMIIHLECQVALSSGFSFRFLFFATIMSSLRDFPCHYRCYNIIVAQNQYQNRQLRL
jgi:hypothetical protein